MPIVATKSAGSGTFTPHPEGQFAAVCADVHDVGMVEVVWQGQTKRQHKVDIYFFCGESKDGDDGKKYPLLVRERFTLTLDDRGRLRPFLENWRGKKFTTEEESGFDLEMLIGAPAFLQISQNTSGDKVYANIDTIMRLPAGLPAPALPADFKRLKDRPAKEGASNGTTPTARHPSQGGPGLVRDVPPPNYDNFDPGPPDDDDDLPF